MRIAALLLVLVSVASFAHADPLPDPLFAAMRGHYATIKTRDGVTLSGIVGTSDPQEVRLQDGTGVVISLRRDSISTIELSEAPRASRLLAPRQRLSLVTNVGLGILGASYGAALVGGASLLIWNRVEQAHDTDAFGPEYYAQGGEVLLPVIGPFLSAAASGNTSWQVPWIADGIVQIAGLTTLVVGLVQARHAAPLAYRGVTFAPSVTPQSIGLAGTF